MPSAQPAAVLGARCSSEGAAWRRRGLAVPGRPGALRGLLEARGARAGNSVEPTAVDGGAGEGKGLGKHEDGMKAHISVKQRADLLDAVVLGHLGAKRDAIEGPGLGGVAASPPDLAVHHLCVPRARVGGFPRTLSHEQALPYSLLRPWVSRFVWDAPSIQIYCCSHWYSS